MKIRIYEVAQEAAKTTQDTLDACNEIGIQARNASSYITEVEAGKILEYLINGPRPKKSNNKNNLFTTRVSEVAKEAVKNNQEVLDACKELNIHVKNASSKLTDKEAGKVLGYLTHLKGTQTNNLIIEEKKLSKEPVRLARRKLTIVKKINSNKNNLQDNTQIVKTINEELKAPESLSNKVPIKDISFEVGLPIDEIFKRCAELGIPVKSTFSKITEEEAQLIYDSFVKNTIGNHYKIEIRNLKSIFHLEFDFKLEKGLYAIIGENGVGKSSFLITLAKLVQPNIFRDELIGEGYKHTKIIYFKDEEKTVWEKDGHWTVKDHLQHQKMPKISGIFESSLLTGSRFNLDRKLIYDHSHNHKERSILASNFIIKNMNYIMNGDESSGKFKTLHKIEGTRKTRVYKELSSSYTMEDESYSYYALIEDDLVIKEFFFSTGELFLLSLLKFLDKFKNRQNHNNVGLVIIDEIELSLHPLAQVRLIEKLQYFKDELNILFFLATHSLHTVERIAPENILFLENDNGKVNINRNIRYGYLNSIFYTHSHFDKILLVEDELLESFINHIIHKIEITGCLYKIIPIGGFNKIIEMYQSNYDKRFFGKADILCIFDRDVFDKVNKGKGKSINKAFLPIDNVEKYTVQKFISPNEDKIFRQYIELKHISPNKINSLGVVFDDTNSERTKNSFKKFIEKAKITHDVITKYIYDELNKQQDKKLISLNKQIEDFLTG